MTKHFLFHQKLKKLILTPYISILFIFLFIGWRYFWKVYVSTFSFQIVMKKRKLILWIPLFFIVKNWKRIPGTFLPKNVVKTFSQWHTSLVIGSLKVCHPLEAWQLAQKETNEHELMSKNAWQKGHCQSLPYEIGEAERQTLPISPPQYAGIITTSQYPSSLEFFLFGWWLEDSWNINFTIKRQYGLIFKNVSLRIRSPSLLW